MFSDSVRNMDPISPGDIEITARHYLQAVKRELHCSAAQKALFLQQMEDSISQYISDNPAASMADLTKEFGTPAEIAKSFLEEADSAVIGKSLRHGRKIFWAVLAVVFIVATIVIGIHAFDLWRSENYRDGYFEEMVTPDAPFFSEDLSSSTQIF